MSEDTKPTVFEAWSAVMGAVQAVEKSERNRDQGFNFRGIDTVVNAVGPVLRDHQVIIIPTVEDITTERYTTSKGAAMKSATVRMRYTVYGPAGDSFSGVTYGEAADSGDKAVSKAQSVAYRVFLLQGLTIPTNDPDPDTHSHERASLADVVRAAHAANTREEITAAWTMAKAVDYLDIDTGSGGTVREVLTAKAEALKAIEAQQAAEEPPNEEAAGE
ncbi:ERF family protein [Nocardia cyriacigeorgica]|uniref:ERF family protein n=1 Tax=Nocardia cyriacigeorgica TaxID=135487 RepID=UPI001893F52A|nr:ERF family protein [Nocardia cyriacigeorgica]MBF6416910.1 ERF family protein [Nocardia cyriacigeorgica]